MHRSIVALSSAFALMFLIAYFYRTAAAQRDAIAAFSRTIELGMPRHHVDRKCEQACLQNPTWRYYPNVEAFGTSVSLVESPLTVGAKNWVVFIAFDADVVAGVFVRTNDTRRLKPQEAPEDRVHDVRGEWLAEFRPE
jgi:hypothetical protein